MTQATEKLGKVAVLMGGTSAEREISLRSGQAVLGVLRASGVDAHAFDPAERPIWELKAQGFDRAFIALHGRFGEDGTVQGALETMGIPYTGSGVMASALSMDKWRTKLIWFSSDVPTPRCKVLTPQSDWAAVAQELGLPLMVKPAREGSSIGISKVSALDEFKAAFEAAYELDALVIAEEFVVGQELTVGILGDVALPIVRIEAPEGRYDYQNKYFTNDVKYHCPAGLDQTVQAQIEQAALRAFRALGCRGWGRTDVMLRSDGSFAFLEMNTAPGMTDHSLVPMAARVAGIEFDALCLQILESAKLG